MDGRVDHQIRFDDPAALLEKRSSRGSGVLSYRQSQDLYPVPGIRFRLPGHRKFRMKYYKKALKIHDSEPYIYYNPVRVCAWT